LKQAPLILVLLTVARLRPVNETIAAPPKKGAEFPERDYSTLRPSFAYSQAVSSLSALNFKNFILHTFVENGGHLTYSCTRVSGKDFAETS
jgi:hypothetical protein